jgi:hypothetical protein
MNVLQDLKQEGQNIIDTVYSKLTVNNLVKYIVQGIVVATAAYVIPNRKTSINEIALIALIASLTFFTLDIFTSDIAQGLRLGTGFGIGMNLVNMIQVPYLALM